MKHYSPHTTIKSILLFITMMEYYKVTDRRSYSRILGTVAAQFRDVQIKFCVEIWSAVSWPTVSRRCSINTFCLVYKEIVY